MNKKGELMAPETIIFVILNVLFFILIMFFLYRASDAVSMYEQAYAKQIALIVDRAVPDSTVSIYMDTGVALAKKYNLPLNQIVRIGDGNRIIVSLAKSGGYTYKYFPDYNVTIQKNLEQGNTLVLNITRRMEP